jgi:hypothetical protein
MNWIRKKQVSILNERYMNEKNEFFIGLKDEVDMIVDFLQQGKISNRFNSIGMYILFKLFYLY